MDKIATFVSVEKAEEDINSYKDLTAYFSGELSYSLMYEMFHKEFHFGEAESHVILASLIKAGARFKSI